MSEVRESTWLIRLWQTPIRDMIRLRLSCRLDWRGVITEASLPSEVTSLLTRLIRKTRLWRIEKTSIAHELVAHFEDAIAAGQGPAQAIERFGDWGKAAKLIRRATKRKRSYAWQAWRYSFWCVVGLVGVYTAMGLYYLTGSRNIAVDYAALINAQAAAVPADECAWPVLRDALIAMKMTNGRIDMPAGEVNARELVLDSARPGDEHWPVASAFLIDHEQSLGEIRRAAGMPGLGYVAGYVMAEEDLPLFAPDRTAQEHQLELERFEQEYADTPPMVSMLLLQNLTSMRRSARILSVDVFRAAEVGDRQTAYADLIAMLGMADHSDEHNTLINQLVALSIRSRAFQTFSELMATYPELLSHEQLIDLAHRIASVHAHSVDFTGERYFMDDLIQHFYTDDGNGNGRLVAQDWQALIMQVPDLGAEPYVGTPENPGLLPSVLHTAITPAAIMIAADRKDLKAMTDRLFNLYQADASIPMWQQPESQAMTELLDLVEGSLLRKRRYLLIAVLMPALDAVREASERYTASADGALTAIALELYRDDQGEYPDTLESLVPRYLPELPIDRITGGPLNYTLKEGKPVLYSLGADRDDDKGTVAYDEYGNRERDIAAWMTNEGETTIDGDWVVWPLHD